MCKKIVISQHILCEYKILKRNKNRLYSKTLKKILVHIEYIKKK